MAVEYAYRDAGGYDLIGWMRAGLPEVLATDYVSLAEPFGLPGPDNEDRIALINSVRAWLDQNRSWLLIFDGAKCAVDLEGYLPQGRGKVVVTPSNPGWPTTLRVKPLERAEAMALLSRYQVQANLQGNAALLEALGYLSLILELAGAYMEANFTAANNYLDLFRSEFWSPERAEPRGAFRSGGRLQDIFPQDLSGVPGGRRPPQADIVPRP